MGNIYSYVGKNKIFSYYYLNSRQLSLSDFEHKINNKTPEEKIFFIAKNENMMLNFVELKYKYTKWIFLMYYCDYTNHLYNQS